MSNVRAIMPKIPATPRVAARSDKSVASAEGRYLERCQFVMVGADRVSDS
jgi:hypothetical protein